MYKMTKEWMERATLLEGRGDLGRVIEFCGTSHVELIRIYDLPEITDCFYSLHEPVDWKDLVTVPPNGI
jgi:hypothetical protein